MMENKELEESCNILMDLINVREKYMYYDEEIMPCPLFNW